MKRTKDTQNTEDTNIILLMVLCCMIVMSSFSRSETMNKEVNTTQLLSITPRLLDPVYMKGKQSFNMIKRYDDKTNDNERKEEE